MKLETDSKRVKLETDSEHTKLPDVTGLDAAATVLPRVERLKTLLVSSSKIEANKDMSSLMELYKAAIVADVANQAQDFVYMMIPHLLTLEAGLEMVEAEEAKKLRFGATEEELARRKDRIKWYQDHVVEMTQLTVNMIRQQMLIDTGKVDAEV